MNKNYINKKVLKTISISLLSGLFLIIISSCLDNDTDTWSITIGKSGSDIMNSIKQTTDGGYIATGVSGVLFPYYEGTPNIWILKIDSSGKIKWEREYNKEIFSMSYSVQQTTDDGYIIAGSITTDTDTFINGYVLKLDSDGNKKWDNTYKYQTNEYNRLVSIYKTTDDGYIIAGNTCMPNETFLECWVLKLDSSGNEEWSKTYSRSWHELTTSIQQTIDGGFIVAGITNFYITGEQDFSLLKLDFYGNEEWNKTYGGDKDEGEVPAQVINYSGVSIQQTIDGGFIVVGGTKSYGAGNSDVWLLKVDSFGNVEWDKTYGGEKDDTAMSIQETDDNGFIIAGYTESFGAGKSDIWLLKVDSFGNVEWDKTYGDEEYDVPMSIQQTSDGGFIVAGGRSHLSFGEYEYDVWILKLDQKGSLGTKIK